MMSGPAKINAFLSNIAGRRFTIANLHEAARHQPALRAAIRAAADASAPARLLQPLPQPQPAPTAPLPPAQPAPQSAQPEQPGSAKWSESGGKFGSGTWG